MRRFSVITLILVAALSTSCEEILLEEDISLAPLEILAPKDSTLVRASAIVFSWTKVQGATSYQLQIATPNFEEASQILIDTEVEENSFTEELPKNNYEWRVKAVNSGYEGPFSFAYFKVEDIEDFSSSRVVLIAPEDNYSTNNLNVDLEWREVEGATEYRLQIFKENNLFKEETTSNTNIIIAFPEGEFTWKVRAENDTQNTFYSERSIIVDTLNPNTPKLLKPTDSIALASGNLTFEWQREPLEGSSEKDSLFVFKDFDLQELVKKEQVNISYSMVLDDQETYYWFMKSYDEAGNESEISEVFSFTIN